MSCLDVECCGYMYRGTKVDLERLDVALGKQDFHVRAEVATLALALAH